MQRKAKTTVLWTILFCFACVPAFAHANVLAETATIPGQTEGTKWQDGIRYGITNAKGINVRKTPDAEAIVVGKLPITGTAVKIVGEIFEKVLWYRIDVEDKRLEGYVRSDLIDEVTEDEYSEHVSASKARQTASGATPSPSSPVSKTQGTPGGHGAYPGTTAVWMENGIYHSDQACPMVESGDAATLQTAQAAGLTPCSLCWCYDCLFGE